MVFFLKQFFKLLLPLIQVVGKRLHNVPSVSGLRFQWCCDITWAEADDAHRAQPW